MSGESVAPYRAGSGDPLVLIHGFGGTWRVWKPVLAPMTAAFEVLAVRLAGHFEASPLPRGVAPTRSALADAVERDMDTAGWPMAHLVGNSLGGWIALELARRGRARDVVAIAPGGGWEKGRWTARRVEWCHRIARPVAALLAPRADRLTRSLLVRRLVFSTVVSRPDLLDPDEAAHWLRAFAGCAIFDELIRSAKHEAPLTGLEDIRCPVLLAWPAKDRVLPSRLYAQPFLDAMPHAESRELPGVGHAPMSDDPELVARTILRFVARRPARIA